MEDNQISTKGDADMRGLRLTTGIVLVLGLSLLAASAQAQTNDKVNAGIQFNFSSPGARSLAFGGAFVGLADDATAAFTNPAGLTTLSLPEVAFEVRSWDYTTSYVDRGNASGQATGGANCRNGVGDCINGVILGETSQSVTGLSYISVVYPRGNWAIAAYRHELARFRATFQDQGIFYDTGSGQTNPGRYFPLSAEMDLDVINYGVSAAFRLSDKVSLGLGGSYYDLKLKSTTRRYNTAAADPFAPGGRFGIPDYSDGNLRNVLTQDGDDTAFGFSAGFLVKATEALSIGGVFRQGPEFDYTSTAFRINPAGASTVVATQLKVPDVAALGFAYRMSDHATLSFQYSRVMYSQLADNMKDAFGNPAIDADAYVVDDANELHLGLEYVILTPKVIVPLRLGVWHDPDHKIRYTGQFAEEQAYFRGGDDEIHYTAGIGIVLGTPFEVNLAYDHSKTVKTVSLSAVIRF